MSDLAVPIRGGYRNFKVKPPTKPPILLLPLAVAPIWPIIFVLGWLRSADWLLEWIAAAGDGSSRDLASLTPFRSGLNPTIA